MNQTPTKKISLERGSRRRRGAKTHRKRWGAKAALQAGRKDPSAVRQRVILQSFGNNIL